MIDESEKGTTRPDFSAWLKKSGWNLGVAVTVFLALAAGFRFIGKLEERVNAAHEGIRRLDDRLTVLDQTLDTKLTKLDERVQSQLETVEAARMKAVKEIHAAVQPQDDSVVFVNGRLTSGLDMGVSSSGGQTNWVTVENESLCMSYPAGQQWGVVFLTVGEPSLSPRPGRDYSSYHSLLVEARGGAGGESVFVGIKDNTDRDDGSEAKVPLRGLTTRWKEFEIDLIDFRTADLTRLYVVSEFVFDGDSPVMVCVRRIEFRP